MRLLYVADAKLPAPAANTIQVMKTCAAFAAAGAEVMLLARPNGVPAGGASAPGAWPAGIAEFYGVPQNFRLSRAHRLFPGRSRRDPWNTAFALSSLVWAARHKAAFDVLYTRVALLALLAARRKIPVAFEIHNELPRAGAWSRRLADGIIRAQAQPAFLGTVAISERLKNLCVADGFEPAKMLVAHDAADLRQFEPTLEKREARRQLRALPEGAVDLPDDVRVVGYSGHFYRGKGLPQLLECAARHPNWIFLLVGGRGEELARCRAAARQRRLHNTRFTGFVPNAQLPPYLFACDVLAMPYAAPAGSAQFMSPMKMFEYLAAGRAMAASDWPQVREILRHEHNALLFAAAGAEPPLADWRDADAPNASTPHADAAAAPHADALDAALSRLMCDDALRQSIARQARADAQNHTWERRAASILQWLAARSGETNTAKP